MSKTYCINKRTGEKYIPRGREQKKKLAKTKYMGNTSGSHSVIYDRETKAVDGMLQVVYTKSDRVSIKGVDYIKYGYGRTSGFQMFYQPKSVLRDKAINKALDEEMQDELWNR